MALWSFTEISQHLGCSVQNISNRKGKLKSMGFIEVDLDGKEKINEAGFNFLKEQRKNTIKNEVNKSNNDLVNEQENISNVNTYRDKQMNLTNEFIVEFLKNEVEELKNRLNEEQEQKKYWQNLYIQQNEDFKKLAFPPMLDTQEGNNQTQEREKRSFWSRLWS